MERCLQKDPAQRLRDIGDVRILLQASLTHPIRPASAARPSSADVAPLVVARGRGRRGRRRVRRRCGRLAASGARRRGRRRALRHRPDRRASRRRSSRYPRTAGGSRSARRDPTALRASSGCARWPPRKRGRSKATILITGMPFWSADSRYIVFSAQGKLRKIDAAGGPAQLLGDVQTMAVGGFSTPDDRIVYAEIRRRRHGAAVRGRNTGAAEHRCWIGRQRRGDALRDAGRQFRLLPVRRNRGAGIYIATPGRRTAQDSARRVDRAVRAIARSRSRLHPVPARWKRRRRRRAR